MIKSLYSGRFIQISSGTSSTNYVQHNTPGSGLVRFNSSNQSFEVNDGHTWQTIFHTSPNIDLSVDAQLAVEWAQGKMREEVKLERLASTNPTLKDLIEQKKSLEEKIRIVQVLLNSADSFEGVQSSP